MIIGKRKKIVFFLQETNIFGNFVDNLFFYNLNNIIMGETDKDLIFSESVKAGKRIYYFDIKQSRNGDRYIAITESKKINEGTIENPRFVFEKHKIFLYKEDYEKFMDALGLTLAKAKELDGTIDDSTSVQTASVVQDEVACSVPAADEPEMDENVGKPEKKSFLDKMKDIF